MYTVKLSENGCVRYYKCDTRAGAVLLVQMCEFSFGKGCAEIL